MRSSIAYGLFWINFFVTISIIVFYTQIGKDGYHSSNYYSYNLRGTKEKLGLNNNEFPKEPRNLKSVDDMSLYILYFDLAAIFFVFILMFSFCLTKNECCTSDPDIQRGFAVGSCYGACICCDHGGHGGTGGCSCESSGGGGDGALGLLILFLIIIVFVAIYFLLKDCGKNI